VETPHYLTLGEAAKATGKSKPTISKYIKNGKISYVSKDDKGYQIDPAELFRVFPVKNEKTLQSLTHDLHDSNPLLTQEIEHLKTALAEKEKTIEGLERDKEYFKAELSKTTTLITDMRQKHDIKPIERGKGFFATLLNKKN
jgi:DNA-binding transcriptional regulator GbsR (MarR family)